MRLSAGGYLKFLRCIASTLTKYEGFSYLRKKPPEGAFWSVAFRLHHHFGFQPQLNPFSNPQVLSVSRVFTQWLPPNRAEEKGLSRKSTLPETVHYLFG